MQQSIHTDTIDPHAKELLTASCNLEKTIAVDEFNKSHNSQYLFAVRLEDNSMQPAFNAGDSVVVDVELSPKPGDYVLAYLSMKKQTVLRKYGESEGCLFQLLAGNELWATVNVKEAADAVVVGVVVEHRRYL